MGSDDDHRRKSRKHRSSGRSKHRSNRDSDHRRHKDEDRQKDRDSSRHKERDRKKSTRDKDHYDNDDDDYGRSKSRGDNKLTEEEERLYAKAREYLKREGKEDDDDSRCPRKHHDHRNGRESKRRRRDDSRDSYDGDASDSRKEKRHRSSSHRHGKDHKRDNGSSSNRKDDDDHGKSASSRHKKKSKHRHNREEEKNNHRHNNKKKHGTTTKMSEGSFRDKTSATINASNLVSLGDVVREPPSDKLDPEVNYFSHNSHLRLFLYRQFGIYFEDLTSEESHEAFREFAKSYNDGKLEGAYYDTTTGGLLPQEALDQCSRTQHQWKFRTSRVEEQSLEMVRAGVKKQTEYNNNNAKVGGTVATAGRSLAYPITRMQNKDREDATNNNNEKTRQPQPQRRSPQEIAAQRHSDRQHRDRIKLANEEIYGVGGKPDHGWERKREKRMQQSEKLHGAARDRDEGAELDDDAIYGAGGGGVGGGGGGGRRGGRGEGSFEEALAKERRYRERKEAEKAARREELLGKEEEKRKKMLEMIGLSGLKAGQKITIAPRNDAA